MPRVGFEPTIPAFERVKTVHALDRAVTVIGPYTLHFVGFRNSNFCRERSSALHIADIYFFYFGATAPIWALAYLHETPRFTSVF
jgi:hypothetical protein